MIAGVLNELIAFLLRASTDWLVIIGVLGHRVFKWAWSPFLSILSLIVISLGKRIQSISVAATNVQMLDTSRALQVPEACLNVLAGDAGSYVISCICNTLPASECVSSPFDRVASTRTTTHCKDLSLPYFQNHPHSVPVFSVVSLLPAFESRKAQHYLSFFNTTPPRAKMQSGITGIYTHTMTRILQENVQDTDKPLQQITTSTMPSTNSHPTIPSSPSP